MRDGWTLDGALDPDIRFSDIGLRPVDPRSILLTGATGLLGAFVLAELLRVTPARIACLVRPGPEPEGRLHAHLMGLGLWEPGFAGRISVVVGDLEAPRLGLPEAEFGALSARVDAIHHCAATAHFLRPYAALRRANVEGTTELLRLAAAGGGTPFHHVSTLAVFFDRNGAGDAPVSELDDPPGDGLRSGYVRSKWVAERRVLEAGRRGLPATVYRTSRITGDSRTGATSNVDDLLVSLLRACVLLGTAPALDVDISMMPTDHVARALVHLSLRPRLHGPAVHLFQPAPIPWTTLLGLMAEAGHPLEVRPLGEWRADLRRTASDRPVHRDLCARLWLLLGPESALFGGRPRYATPGWAAELAEAGIACPPIDAALVGRYLRFLGARQLPPRGSNA